MSEKLSRLLDVSNAEYEYITIQKFMNSNRNKCYYDVQVYDFYLKLYEYAKKCNIHWFYIHRDILMLGQLFVYLLKNKEITPKILVEFHNILANNNNPYVKPYYIRLLFTKIAIQYKLV